MTVRTKTVLTSALAFALGVAIPSGVLLVSLYWR